MVPDCLASTTSRTGEARATCRPTLPRRTPSSSRAGFAGDRARRSAVSARSGHRSVPPACRCRDAAAPPRRGSAPHRSTVPAPPGVRGARAARRRDHGGGSLPRARAGGRAGADRAARAGAAAARPHDRGSIALPRDDERQGGFCRPRQPPQARDRREPVLSRRDRAPSTRPRPGGRRGWRLPTA